MASKRFGDLQGLHDLSGHVPLLLLVAGVTYAFVKVCYNLYFHPLSSLPGPKTAGATYAWLYLVGMSGQRVQVVHELHKRYGPIVRIAPNIVSFLDQSVLPLVYGRFPKSNFYVGSKMMDGTQDHTFTTIAYADHQPVRKVTGPTYSQQNVNEFAPDLEENIKLMLDRIDESGDHGRKAVDVMYLIKLLACDAVGIVGFGQHWGSVQKLRSDAVDWTDGKSLAVILRSANYDWVIRNVFERLPIKALKRAFQHERNFEVYAEGLLQPQRMLLKEKPELLASEKQTLMTRLLTTPLSTTGRPADDRYITCELVAHVSAGSDTSAVTTSYILYNLALNPHCMQRLQAELDEVMGAERTIDLRRCKDVAYLEAVMQEGLRLHSSAPAHLEREVPMDVKDLEICGMHIPPGSVVATQAWSVHRDPEVFADPERFWPERWLKETSSIDSDTRLEMQRRMMPFGIGSRVCVGRNLAGANMRMAVAALVHAYDITPHPDTNSETMKMAGLFIQAPKHHYCRLHFTPRGKV